MATDILKFLNSPSFSLQCIKSKISGWSTRSIPILAPRLTPPCFIASVAQSKTFINETGPLETPIVDETISFLGLKREKEKPVPPPDLCIKAVAFTASNMLSIESSTGNTKHAESWPSGLPALTKVGVFGRNFKLVIIS